MKNILIFALTFALLVNIYGYKEHEVGIDAEANVEMDQTPELDEAIVRRCMDDVDLAAFKNVQRTACYVSEVERLEEIRLEVLKELINKSPENSAQKLFEAEKAWLYSHDMWCNYIGILPMAPLPLFNRQFCLAEEVKKHVQSLRSVLNEVRSIVDD